MSINKFKSILFHFSLTSLIKDGSNLPNQGATINSAQSTSTVIIRANDEPHGIVGWQRTIILAQESEATNSSVQLVIERQLGSISDIKVLYSTVRAKTNGSVNERPAVPNQDFIPVSSEILMADGVNVTNISIHVIHVSSEKIYNAKLMAPFTLYRITFSFLLYQNLLKTRSNTRFL